MIIFHIPSPLNCPLHGGQTDWFSDDLLTHLNDFFLLAAALSVPGVSFFWPMTYTALPTGIREKAHR